MSKKVIKTTNIHKSFPAGSQQVSVLKSIDFEVEAGDFFVIFGPSGCGKSTLLHVVLGLEEPEKGQVELLGQNLYLNKTED
ncbi:MAG: ATP-binding cassette domain-containing protein, partial [Candidatus Pacebacteria bacterium]|nr:ATP-binding cassette domain-containing protein [Candidatus Paceibacterota bacterium]